MRVSGILSASEKLKIFNLVLRFYVILTYCSACSCIRMKHIMWSDGSVDTLYDLFCLYAIWWIYPDYFSTATTDNILHQRSLSQRNFWGSCLKAQFFKSNIARISDLLLMVLLLSVLCTRSSVWFDWLLNQIKYQHTFARTCRPLIGWVELYGHILWTRNNKKTQTTSEEQQSHLPDLPKSREATATPSPQDEQRHRKKKTGMQMALLICPYEY